MPDVMNQCAKCGTTTEVGELFRFYFGVIVHEAEAGATPDGKPIDPGPIFQLAFCKDSFP